MTLLAGENIVKQFDDRILFDNLTFSINEKDRIGLVGPNGIGKTTLFEIMAGRARPDSGSVVRARGCLIAYVEQELGEEENNPLFDYVRSARSNLLELKSEIELTEKKLLDQPESGDLLEKLGDLQHRFEASGGYDFDSEIRIILTGLGFSENRFHNRLREFSGGEKSRAALARILAGRDNLLLLDEPTNHLDLDSTIWLEEYLKGLDKAYIIVSHDRTFLTNTVEKVWEISSRKIEQYFNGFAQYLEERDQRKVLQRHLHKHQQEEIRRIEDFIRRNIAGQKTRQAKSKQKYLKRMKRIELPESESRAPSFSVNSGERPHNLVLAADSVSFGYGNHALVREVDFNLYRGERVGLIGKNGSGKTTVLKTILGDLEPVEGSIKVGRKVDPAYFDQELSELDENNSILDELWLVDPMCEAGRLRSFLAKFGFTGDDVFKKVAVLSGGEKTKLALAKLMFKPANLLIFDEPTNHLDLDSRQALEEALREYTGTFLVVSHDRYFLDRVTEKIMAIEGDRIRTYAGGYSYYKEKKESEKPPPAKKPTDPEKVQQYVEFKKLSQAKGRIKKEHRSVTSKIADHERKLARLEKDINYNIPKTDWQKLAEASEEKSRIEVELFGLYNRLEELERLNAEYSDADGQSD
ncbi:MAG: ABC-F family ATP-binding cassette domain-containing protein [Candidatus Zixiibacteriota bacterium]|nr:MAG: ABC-F family ATP-binding cassette domain-containing protein [candidate division Zixibacteria bacterium]